MTAQEQKKALFQSPRKAVWKIAVAAVAGAAVLAGAGFGAKAYDEQKNGFAYGEVTICMEQEYHAVLKSTEEDLTWKSSDEDVAVIDQEGTVTGVSPGTVVLTAQSGWKSYQCQVIVREHELSAATCEEPETCSYCARQFGEPLGHDSSKATCEEPAVCARCGEATEEAKGHAGRKATCTTDYVCRRCGETIEKALGHDYAKATCEKPATCTRCFESKGEPLGHDYAAATCVLPETCKRCGATQGEPLGHKYAVILCMEPAACSVCGERQEKAPGHDYAAATCVLPATCRRCGAVQGEPLGHDLTEATCTFPAVCKRCGAAQGQALGHAYVDQGVKTDSSGREYQSYVCERCLDEQIEYILVSPMEGDAYSAMIALQSSYPEGMAWTNDNYYAWNGGIYSGGYGCAGFAFLLSDAAFGSLPARMHYDASNVRVGDILRMNGNTHSVIVLSVDSDGVTVAEGNYNNSIHWGRKISTDELQGVDYVMTRYVD